MVLVCRCATLHTLDSYSVLIIFFTFQKGTRVWHRHPELVWIPGVLEHDVTFATNSVRILLENDEVCYPREGLLLES